MIKNQIKRISCCRICHNNKLKKILSLGTTPLANAFLKRQQLNIKESFFPLKVYFCPKCYLLQLGHVISGKVMFTNYLYKSSTSPVFIKHFENYAYDVNKKFKLNPNSLVVDIGSNDGILLKPFKKLGVGVLGVDPAIEISRQATKDGLETIPAFFNHKLAEGIRKKYGCADVITANNVFAHVNDVEELIKAVKSLLKKDGIFVIEVPYLVDFLQKRLFDTIYHEHLSYFSISPLKVLFNMFQMSIFDVRRVDSHGCSIRVFIKNMDSKQRIKKSVNNLIKLERKLKLDKLETYIEFAHKIEENKQRLILLLKKIKADKKTIVGYGAAAKANTLLNYFNIDQNTLDYIVDDSPLKQNLYTPGTHIPVVSSRRLLSDKPDYILILAWNFADSIIKRYLSYKKRGGHFILPVPKPQII